MDGWEWTKIGTAVSAAIGVAIGASWFGDRLVAPAYPEQSAYQPAGAAQPVDLAALQRSWPAGLDAPGDQSRLAGYMDRIDHGALAAPPVEAAAATPTAPPPDLGTLLAAASAEKGKGTARVCATCHTFDRGGPDHTGPNLWAIVGRDIAARPGFAYSTAVARQAGNWTYERLDAYLTSPARAIPGNKMAFAGIRRAEDRAGLLAYLGSLNATPAPFPAPKAEKAP